MPAAGARALRVCVYMCVCVEARARLSLSKVHGLWESFPLAQQRREGARERAVGLGLG